MKGYALAALDMDGTLLNTAHETTACTRSVLERAAKSGCVLALCTGRCLSELKEHLRMMPGIRYVIGENGAWLYDVERGADIRRIVLDDAQVDFIFDAAAGCDVVWQAFIDGQSWMQCDPEKGLDPYHIGDFESVFRAGSVFVGNLRAICREKRGLVGKVNIYFRRPDDRERFMRRMADRPLMLSASIGVGCEISPSGADKGSGLRALCEHLGLSLSQTMAIGDGGNDLDLMNAAGFAVAMGNAIESVRAIADAVTDDCDHDGAAHAIERYML